MKLSLNIQPLNGGFLRLMSLQDRKWCFYSSRSSLSGWIEEEMGVLLWDSVRLRRVFFFLFCLCYLTGSKGSRVFTCYLHWFRQKSLLSQLLLDASHYSLSLFPWLCSSEQIVRMTTWVHFCSLSFETNRTNHSDAFTVRTVGWQGFRCCTMKHPLTPFLMYF